MVRRDAWHDFNLLNLFGLVLRPSIWSILENVLGFPGGSEFPGGKEFSCNARAPGDEGSIPGLGKFPGGGHGNPLQYSCLENLMDCNPDGLWSLGLQRVGCDWSDSMHTENILHALENSSGQNTGVGILSFNLPFMFVSDWYITFTVYLLYQ